ncbi:MULTISPECIES: glycosyltransferase family 2 protein [Enterococcus]|uniref:glycosyltransferase family 2 protein n=1 Tax=Enterococcus TaxID=1350 RepID=UPI001C102C0A|nr:MULTISPECIES: glycosyltransferase family A protein [Enterococcus]MBU5368239.1 glycosyltransferase family 2 protein [Enterococcus avium]MDO7799177.1 glycosyltransferase family A protein [Enterococcus avium]MDT2421955.1 glycosyltransferase family A protein [Enterococcus avium]MDT2614225.1 glycosyltransferase family A protein [Enterococcus dongliensis]
MSEPQFSIIIPIYNAEMTIARTISVLKKIGNENFEVLLVNDGSTDSTEKVVKDSVENDSRFQLLNKKNEGPGLARNLGIEQAKGDYLLFFDADDFPKETILDDYIAIISSNHQVDLIISSFTFKTLDRGRLADEKNFLVDECMYERNEEFLLDMYELMNKQLMYVVWNKCYRRDIILGNEIRFKNYRSCEDRLFNLDYYKHCSKIVMNPKIEYVYEFEGGLGITNQYNKDKFATFKEFYLQSNTITNYDNKEGMAALLLKGTTSVIFSILETKKISKKQKKNEIATILNDSSIVEARKIATNDTFAKKITKLLFNMPKPIFILVLNTGAFVETKMPGLMAFLKRKY